MHRIAWLRKLDPLNLIVWAEKRGSAVEAVVAWLLLPFILLRLVLIALPMVVGLILFWTVPTVVWLATFRGVGAWDAARYAAFLASGRPQYDGPFGMNNDPATLGFGLLTIAGWVVLLSPFALVVWLLSRGEGWLRGSRRGRG